MTLNYVTDTHSLVWYFTDDQHLSKKALKSFESTVKEGQIIVSTAIRYEACLITRDEQITKSKIVKTIW